MKLHVPQGPLPIQAPYIEWDEGDFEEIDLSTLFDSTAVTASRKDISMLDTLPMPTRRSMMWRS